MARASSVVLTPAEKKAVVAEKKVAVKEAAEAVKTLSAQAKITAKGHAAEDKELAKAFKQAYTLLAKAQKELDAVTA